jgi:osmotically-inducible protein OsmY
MSEVQTWIRWMSGRNVSNRGKGAGACCKSWRGQTEFPGDSGHSSEEFLEAQVQTDLREACYHAIRRVKCQLHSGVLTLQGQVPSYYYKQLAQVVAHRRLSGAALVQNRLEVVAAIKQDGSSPETD